MDIWYALPDLLLDNNLVSGGDKELPTGWKYFPQRIPVFMLSGIILLGAWGWGACCLRVLRLKQSLNWLESLALGLPVGLGLISILTLGLGYAGIMHRWLTGLLLIAPALLEMWKIGHEGHLRAISLHLQQANQRQQIPTSLVLICVALIPFLSAMALGTVLPETDFDCREYHLEGPKEFFLNGRISMLTHNVYTSFPFLTEMLTLTGMILAQDWMMGSLVGKGVLMSFLPISALAIFVLADKYWNRRAAWIAILIFLTTPWVYRIAIISYTEGALCCYVSSTILAVMLAMESWKTLTADNKSTLHIAWGWPILAGMLGGCAVSTKYPGLVTVTIPLGVVLLVGLIRQLLLIKTKMPQIISVALKVSLAYAVGVLITFGPWVAKNLVETGNPVYPLMYGVFGGYDLTPELVAKWKRGHSPDHYQLSDIAIKLNDVMVKSDWQSPLVFGLLPFALIIPSIHRKYAIFFALYVLYFFGIWWLFTHRLDRFWVPLLPIACIVSGMGYVALTGWSRLFARGVLILAVVYNFAFVTTILCGNNSYFVEYTKLKQLSANRALAGLNDYMQAHPGTALLVGEAEVFDAQYPVIYNTVFDQSVFEQWCAEPNPTVPANEWKLLPKEKIEETFRSHNITCVMVNWGEILRYRQTYGYTPFVTPKRIQELQQLGILQQALPNQQFFHALEDYSTQTVNEIRKWAPELIRVYDNKEYFATVLYYPVLK
jgi:hypothetical protein